MTRGAPTGVAAVHFSYSTYSATLVEKQEPMTMSEDERKESANTVFRDAVDEFMRDDGILTKEEYEIARKLAEKEGDRRSHTFFGLMRRQWVESQKKIVLWFFGLFAAIGAAITVLFTDGALKIIRQLLEKV